MVRSLEIPLSPYFPSSSYREKDIDYMEVKENYKTTHDKDEVAEEQKMTGGRVFLKAGKKLPGKSFN